MVLTGPAGFSGATAHYQRGMRCGFSGTRYLMPVKVLDCGRTRDEMDGESKLSLEAVSVPAIGSTAVKALHVPESPDLHGSSQFLISWSVRC